MIITLTRRTGGTWFLPRIISRRCCWLACIWYSGSTDLTWRTGLSLTHLTRRTCAKVVGWANPRGLRLGICRCDHWEKREHEADRDVHVWRFRFFWWKRRGSWVRAKNYSKLFQLLLLFAPPDTLQKEIQTVSFQEFSWLSDYTNCITMGKRCGAQFCV